MGFVLLNIQIVFRLFGFFKRPLFVTIHFYVFPLVYQIKLHLFFYPLDFGYWLKSAKKEEKLVRNWFQWSKNRSDQKIWVQYFGFKMVKNRSFLNIYGFYWFFWSFSDFSDFRWIFKTFRIFRTFQTIQSFRTFQIFRNFGWFFQFFLIISLIYVNFSISSMFPIVPMPPIFHHSHSFFQFLWINIRIVSK